MANALDRLASARKNAREDDFGNQKRGSINSTGNAQNRLSQASTMAKRDDRNTPVVSSDKSASDRIGAGVKSIGMSLAATLPLIGETAQQFVKNDETNAETRSTEAYRALAQEYRDLQNQKSVLNPKSANYREQIAAIQRQMEENENKRKAMMSTESVDPNSTGMSMMRKANQLRAEATEGMSGAGKFLADTAIGIGQNVALLPTAAINPVVPLVAMGAQSGAQKMYEVQEGGGSATEALGRGVVSGAIEAITEKIPLDTLLDVAKTGGKTAVKNILQQAGIEAGEETISYLANLGADVMAGDENAKFSGKDMALSALGGAISGGVLSGGATAVNRAVALPVAKSTPTAAQKPAISSGGAVLLPVANAQQAASGQQKTASTGETETTSVDTNPFTHTMAENRIISEYKDAVDQRVLDFYQSAVKGENPKPLTLNPVSVRAANDIKRLVDRDVSGFKTTFEARQAEHIHIDHGESGRADHTMADPNDVARLQYVLDNYDEVYDGGRTDAYWEPNANGKNRQARTVVFAKKVNGTYYVVEAVPVTKAKSVNIVSAYMLEQGKLPPGKNKKIEGNSQLPDAKAPWFTAKTDSATIPSIANNSITQEANSVKNSGPVSLPVAETRVAPLPVAKGVRPDDSVGAAPAGFVGDTERGFSKNLATDKGRHEEIQHEYKVNPQMYHRLANAETLQKAADVMSTGLENAKSILEQAIGAAQAGKKLSPEMVPLAKMVADELAVQNRMVEAENILSAIAVELTEAGQLGQAANILRDASPMTRRKSIKKMVDKLNEKYKGKAEIKVDDTLLDEYINAQTEEAQAEVLDKVYKNIAAQVPSTWQDKWNAWRYLAMLGNPRTHARNLAGNALFQPVRVTKDAVAAAIESVAARASGGKMQRTKTFTADPALYKAAMADWKNVKDDLSQDSKYNEGIGAIESRKQVFALPILEKARKGNTKALEGEDIIFKRFTYADALAKYLKANGVTAQQLTDGTVNQTVLSKAREYAGKEALRATYQDKNDVSDLVSKLGKYHGDNKAAKFISAIVEGVLPFRRTPANILVRGMEYSPAGLAKGLTYDLYKVKTGEKSAAEAIDGIAAGLTGTGLLTAGAILSAMGIVSPGDDSDEKQAALDDLTGKQGYALNLPDGTSYTMDWAAPAALPFFMGTELAESIMENGFTVDGLFEMLKSVSEPMLEMSMLQSLNDMIDSVSYSDNKLGGIVTSSLISYLNQGIPTIGGQIERTVEDKRMTTYTDKTLPLPTDVQYALGKAAARLPLPGVDYQQIPYIDAWGREEATGDAAGRAFENFLSPGYVSKDNTTAVDREVQRLYTATGEGSVVPGRAAKSFTVNKKTVNLSKEQYVKYATVKGQTAFDVVESMISSSTYKGLSDVDKVGAVSNAYEYANAIAKAEVSNYQLTGWVKKAKDSGVDPGLYILYKATVDADGNSSITQEEAKNAIVMLPISQSAKANMWQSQNSSWKEKSNPFK